ncbi:MAG TPA: ATP-binding protein [Actinomycetota bacterium]|jgi:signal transduction histidine kinase
MLRRNRPPRTAPPPEATERLGAEVARLSEERALTNEILERMSEGVLVVSEDLSPVMANRAARRLLGADDDSLRPDVVRDELLSLARRVVVDRADAVEVVDLPDSERTSIRVSGSYLARQGGAVLVLHDISDEQRAQRIRRQFVTHASHELKTPIAAIQALAEAMRDASVDEPDRARHFADRVVHESERLSRLVADLLDLSRVEDPVTIASTAANLSAVVEGALDDALPLARAKDIAVRGSIAPGVRVKGDADQLGLMARNLLENAIRYTEQGGHVDVEVAVDVHDAWVKVTDDGIGIPMRHQSRVFERFYRVDKGRSREEGGTGLGLAIVKHVADLHGGHVELKSEFGEGSMFTVRMPALHTPPDEEREAV